MIIANKVKRETQLRNVGHSYRCPCGFSTDVKICFKKHILDEHNGLALPHSSHFIEPFMGFLLPHPENKQFKQQFASFDASSSDQELDKQLTSHDEKIVVKKRKPGRPKKKKTQKSVKKANLPEKDQELIGKNQNQSYIIPNLQQQTKENFPEYLKNNDFAEEQDIQSLNRQWNGFKLIKNTNIKAKSYCCGQCKSKFEGIQEFITHCIEECQELNHPCSSHIIKFSQEAESLHQQMQIPQEIVSKVVQEEKTRKTRIKRKVNYQDRRQMTQMQALLLNQAQANNLFCKSCNKVFLNKPSYRIHVHSTAHCQVIDSGFSHIMLRYKKADVAASFIAYQYIELLQEIETEAKYYCPCNQQSKMNLNQLKKHVYEVHKGISPCYNNVINLSRRKRGLIQD